MYAYIKGTLIAREEASVIVETSGIGYSINMSPGLSASFAAPGDQVMIHTYLHVRDDVFELYGFPQREQLNLFKLLITVSRIGPKLATTIVDTLPADQFALAVMNADVKTLTTVKGLGKKGAERLILEIRDKVKANLQVEGDGRIGLPAATDRNATDGATADGDMREDVVNALLVLGFSAGEATEITASTFDPQSTLETNISSALRSAAKA